MSANTAPTGAKPASARRAAPVKASVAPTIDYPLIAILATLVAIGLAEVFSASLGTEGSNFFLSQVGWVTLGILVMILGAIIPYRFWQRGAVPIMILTLIVLVAVLVLGKELLGARRTLFSGRVQPSEFAKLAVVIYVAAWVASKKDRLRNVTAGLIPFAIVMGVVSALLIMEPSFSVTIIILVTGVTIFFVGGGDLKQLLVSGAIAAVVLVILIYEFHYGKTRIDTWWLALTDPNNAPYDVAKVHEVIRRGGGIGTRPDNWLLKGSVPLLWSDYLFANIAADLKFLGATAVVVLFAALGYRGLSIALNAQDQFGALVAIDIAAWILTQAFIHMGTSVALIPATGIPLPFMSYGGSAMLASMAAMGLLLSISRASPEKKPDYAHFLFGWRNRRPRVSNSGSSQRAEKPKSAPATKPAKGSSQPAKPAPKAQGRGASKHYQHEVRDWRSASATQPPTRRRRSFWDSLLRRRP